MVPKLYCVMITGKNEDRYKFVPIAISNFNSQSYPNKHLIVINHGPKSITELSIPRQDNVYEIMFSKHESITLGDMRNFAHELVPFGAIWTVWDDDDWRHRKYLQILYDELHNNNADAVFIKNRLDVNVNTNYVYKSKFEKGTPFFFGKKIDALKYLSKDSLEDIRLQNDLEMFHKKIIFFNNDPRLYIRTIHGSNTSLYVDHNKKDIVIYSDQSMYHEYDATEKEKSYAQKIIRLYFNSI